MKKVLTLIGLMWVWGLIFAQSDNSEKEQELNPIAASVNSESIPPIDYALSG